jgi:hypothetical protein
MRHLGIGAHLWDFLAGVFVLAAVYVLVRPSSPGAELVKALGNAMTAIVSHATDLATT